MNVIKCDLPREINLLEIHTFADWHIGDADIYIHSHTHLPFIMKQSFHRTDMPNSYIARVDKLFVNTSAMLNYGGYGEQYEFKPSSKDTPTIYLNGNKKKMYAKL